MVYTRKQALQDIYSGNPPPRWADMMIENLVDTGHATYKLVLTTKGKQELLKKD